MRKKTLRKIVQALETIFVILVFVIGFTYITEYRPKDVEPLTLSGKASETLSIDEEISILTYDVNHLVEGDLKPETEDIVTENLEGVSALILEQDADIVLLQDVDYEANISYNINEYRKLSDPFNGLSTYSISYKSFVPYPLYNMKGSINSGQVSLSVFDVVATRIALNNAYNYPKRLFFPKKAILKQEIEIEGQESRLVVLNVHLDDLDEGDIRRRQLESLKHVMLDEYEKGNYCIVGGNFNQKLSEIESDQYIVANEESEYATIEMDFLDEGWTYAVDKTTPTLKTEKTYYITDGYILSPNVELVEVKTITNEFEYSNNNPVSLKIKLKH